MEGETDFDPTTEEGQADINDDDYDALFTEDESPRRFFDRMVDRFGSAWRRYMPSIRRMWQSRNPGQAAPPYLRLEQLNTVEDPVEAAKERLSELYENFNFDEVQLSEKDGNVYIQTENAQEHAKSKWTKPQRLFTQEGEVREDVKRLKGFQMASRGLLGRLEEVNARVAAEKRVQELEKTLEEMQRRHEEAQAKLKHAGQQEGAALTR